VHNQFKRLKGLEEAHDAQLHAELTTVLDETTERLISRAELEKLAEKFELTTAKAIKQETQALEWMKIERDPLIDGILDNEKGFEQMHTLLRNMKTLCPADNLEVDIPDLKKIQASEAAFLDKLRAHHPSEPSVSGGTDKGGSPNIPDDFKCPISLDLMKDPDIVATGQVGSVLLCVAFSSPQLPSFGLSSSCPIYRYCALVLQHSVVDILGYYTTGIVLFWAKAHRLDT